MVVIKHSPSSEKFHRIMSRYTEITLPNIQNICSINKVVFFQLWFLKQATKQCVKFVCLFLKIDQAD